MIVETSLRRLGLLEICVEVRTVKGFLAISNAICCEECTYLNSFSSSMTCMPCSYWSFVGASPTEAKWPFIVMTEGAVWNRDAAEGRRCEIPVVGIGDDMILFGTGSRFGDL